MNYFMCSASNFSISVFNSATFFLECVAKSEVLSAYIIDRDEFTRSPHLLFMPYFATSDKLPP